MIGFIGQLIFRCWRANDTAPGPCRQSSRVRPHVDVHDSPAFNDEVPHDSRAVAPLSE
jgi:hypothetical protein